jgi:hypothetical protein
LNTSILNKKALKSMRTIFYTALIAIFSAVCTAMHAAAPLGIKSVPKPGRYIPKEVSQEYYYKDIAAMALIGEYAALIGKDVSEIKAHTLTRFLVRFGSDDSRSVGYRSSRIASSSGNSDKFLNPQEIDIIKRAQTTLESFSHDQRQTCYLHECVAASCPFTRFTHPEVRSFFEKTIVRETAHLPIIETYVSFASGKLSQDASILKKIAQTEKRVKHVVLIDPLYTEMLNLCNASSLQLSITDRIGESIDWLSLYNAYHERPLPARPNQAFLDVLLLYAQVKNMNQFVDLLHTYAMGIEQVCIYKDADDYKADYEEHSNLKPTLINSCDIKYINLDTIDVAAVKARDTSTFTHPELNAEQADILAFSALANLAQDADVACILAQDQYAKGKDAQTSHVLFQVISKARSNAQQWRWAGEWLTQECYDSLMNPALTFTSRNFPEEIRSTIAVADYNGALWPKLIQPKFLLPTLIGVGIAGYAWQKYSSHTLSSEAVEHIHK